MQSVFVIICESFDFYSVVGDGVASGLGRCVQRADGGGSVSSRELYDPGGDGDAWEFFSIRQ